MSASKPTLMRRLHGMMFKLPLMITCEEFEDFILAYLEDELPPKQKTVFEMHLKLCRECRDYLRAYKASMALAQQAMSERERAEIGAVPEDLVKAVLDARAG